MQSRELVICSLVQRQVLASRSAGEADRPALSSALDSSGHLSVFDFASIQALTPSYFSSGLLPLWRDQEVALAAKNLGSIREDLETCLDLAGVALWDFDHHEPRGLGALDSSATETLKLCAEKGSVTAAELSTLFPSVKRTAWNNRLASLFEKRLLRREQHGKSLVYSVPWLQLKGGTYGRRFSQKEA